MICTYDEMYLPLSQRVLGNMYDFAVNTLHYSIIEFQKMFIGCRISNQIEIGNPTYVAGKNGCELAKDVIAACGLPTPDTEDIMYVDKSREYWVGWTLSYYQWYSGYHFSEIDQCVPISEFCNMHPTYHEADIILFVEYPNKRMNEYDAPSALRRLRVKHS